MAGNKESSGEQAPSKSSYEMRSTPGRGFGNAGGRGMPKVRPKNTKETLTRLWSYLKRQHLGLVAVFILTALSSIFTLLGPFLIGKAIDDFISLHDYQGLLTISLVLLAVYILAAAATWLQAYVMASVSQQTVWDLRNDLFAKLQQLPIRYFDSKTHGELMSRTTNDVENISQVLNQSVTQLISSLITVVGTIAIMLYLNVWLTLVTLLSIPLVMLVTANIAKFTRKYFSEQQKHLGQLNGYIEETVTGQKVVKTFCHEQKSLEEFDEINVHLRKAGIKAQIFSVMIFPVMNVMNNLSFALIAGVGGWMTVTGGASVGTVVSFLQYSRQFGRPINELANLFNLIQSAIAGAERVFEVMDVEPEYVEGIEQEQRGVTKRMEIEKESKIEQGEVVFQNVDFSYTAGEPILKNVSLTAPPGSTIALVGPTGAGKTTIVNLLTRFYEIDKGTITIDGKNLQSFDKHMLRQQLGIVLQDAYLFSDTIRENIRYGRLDASDQEVEEAARLANADSFIRKLPKGYDSLLTAEGNNLSEGQRQLVTIARAILADPSILILDEATSSIDTRSEIQIQEAMLSLMEGRTSFVIAHRLSTIREADMILVINNGEIIERGNHQQLLEQEGFYHQLYTSQFERAG